MVKISKARSAIQAILEEDDSYSQWLMNRLIHNLLINTPMKSKFAYDLCHGFENNFKDVLDAVESGFPKEKKKNSKGEDTLRYPEFKYSQSVNKEDWECLKKFAEAKFVYDDPEPSIFAKNAKNLGHYLNLTAVEIDCLLFIKAIADSDPAQQNFVTDLLKSSSERFPAFIAFALDRVDDYQEIAKAVSPSGRLAEYGILDYSEPKDDGHGFPIIEFDLKEVLCEPEFDKDKVVEQIIGSPVKAELTIDDNFLHLKHKSHQIVKAINSARAKGKKGINVVLYGPAGSGKTELAKAIFQAAGLDAYAVGEDVESNMSYGETGGKIDSSKRLVRLRQAQAFLSDSPKAGLIMDEMEDFLVKGEDSSKSADSSSKILLNRTLEDNLVPTIWLANDIGKFHASVKQRFKLPLQVGYQPTLVSKNIWTFHIKKNGLKLGRDAAMKLARKFDAPPRVIAQACEVASLLDGSISDVMEQVRYKSSLDFGGYNSVYDSSHPVPHRYSTRYLSSSMDVQRLEDVFLSASNDRQALSILIEGESKVGKSTLAYYLAEKSMRHVSSEDMEDMIVPTQQTEPVNHVSIAFAKAAKADAIMVIENFDKLFANENGERDRKKMVEMFMDEMESHSAPVVLIQSPESNMPDDFRAFMDVQTDLSSIEGKKLQSAFKRYIGTAAPKGSTSMAIGGIARLSRSLRVQNPDANKSDLVTKRIAATMGGRWLKVYRIWFEALKFPIY